LEKNDDIIINDIERIVEKALTFQDSSKNSKQIREELQEVDDIIQEFMKEKNLCGNEERNKKPSQEVNNLEERSRMNEVLGLFTVAIFAYFLAPFQFTFWLLFISLAEESTKSE